MKDIYMVTKSTNVYYITTNPIFGQHRGCPWRGRTSGTAYHHRGGARRAQTWWGCVQRWEWAIGKAVASGVFVRRHLQKPPRRFGVSKWKRTHPYIHVHTLFEYPPGKPLEDKLLKEFSGKQQRRRGKFERRTEARKKKKKQTNKYSE